MIKREKSHLSNQNDAAKRAHKMQPPKTPTELLTLLTELGCETTTHNHEAHYSVAEAKKLRGTMQGHFTKNLFLTNKKKHLFLVTALEDQPINLKNLGRQLNESRLSFAKAETMQQILGIEPGSVTPFALINDHENQVQPILDAFMQDKQTLNFHPLTNTKTTSISYSDLIKFFDHTGHKPEVVNFNNLNQPENR